MEPTVSIHRDITIVTSGYDDRFISTTSTYELKYKGTTGNMIEVHFHDERDALDFMQDGIGMEFGAAYDAVNKKAKTIRHIAGWITPRHWSSMPISYDDLSSIQTMLDLRTPARFYPEHIEKLQGRIEKHPIEGDLLAIVNYQLSECDRLNVWKWGSPNGQTEAKP
jgi:hypothetical protein